MARECFCGESSVSENGACARHDATGEAFFDAAVKLVTTSSWCDGRPTYVNHDALVELRQLLEGTGWREKPPVGESR